MAYIIEVVNPYQPLTGMKKYIHPGGITIREWLQETYPGFVEFEKPTICIVNGEPLLRVDWDREIRDNDIVNFVTIIGYSLVVIIILVIIIVLVVVLILTMQPSTPGELPGSDPVFSVKGQTNQIRLAEPIEVNYGRNRIYPSYASRSYFRYEDNDQFLYSLFCLGQGQYEIEEVRIGDTDITVYQEAEYEIIPPGSTTTLFHTNVDTSLEAGGQTLWGTNDSEYGADGWIGPFAVCSPGETVYRIEIDIVMPRGLYTQNKKGKIKGLDIGFEVQAREIDDTGTPLTGYSLIMTPYVYGAVTTPQRRTFGVGVASARYEVRVRRTYTRSHKSSSGHDSIWEAMRGFVEGDEPDFGDLTLLAVKIRATSNLNARTQERFNVIATRKLPIRESGGGFSEPVVTRSIIWAYVDVLRSNYGGRITDELFYDWEALEALDALYAGRGEYFDWTFRDSITVWDAARTIMRVGRAVPLLAGSLLSAKRDGPLSVPVTLFTPDNIVKDSFQWEIKLWEPSEFDAISVEYTESSTGYKQEQVLAILPGSSTAGDYVRDIRLPGVQNRNHAYREGLYMLASERYLRENISFETGLEGLIPAYGDLVAISHDVPRWGQAGIITHVVQGDSGSDDYHLFVSEPLSFVESGTYVIALRGSLGQVLGPYTAQQTSDPMRVMINTADTIDFLLGGQTEPMLFQFGLSGAITKYAKVVKVEPQGGERVKITCVNDEAVIHSFDSLPAPALTFPSLPPTIPDLPIISEMFLKVIDGTQQHIQVSWLAAFGAQRYIIQVAYETESAGQNWSNAAETVRTSVEFQVRPGTVYVRVAAINNGQGPWVDGVIAVGLIGGLVNDVPWDALSWGIRWWEDLNIDAYLIKVYDLVSASDPVLKRTTQQAVNTFTYDYDMAATDGNLVREMRVEVDSMVEDEDTLILEADNITTSIDLSNAIPATPTGMGYEFLGLNSDETEALYRVFWTNPAEDDLIRIKVWLSAVDGFDPAVDAPVVDDIASSPGNSNIPSDAYVNIALDSFAEHAIHYWRVGVFDVWGNEISTNISAQQTIPAYS